MKVPIHKNTRDQLGMRDSGTVPLPLTAFVMYNKRVQQTVEEKLGIPGDYQYKAWKSKNLLHSNWHANKLHVIDQLYIKDNKTYQILDLGIGAGIFEMYFTNKVKSIVGIDHFKSAVEFFQGFIKDKNITNVEVFHRPLEELAQLETHHKFDLVVILDVIEHLDPQLLSDTLQHIKGLLAKNGKVVVTTPNYKSGWVLLEKILDVIKIVPTLDGAQHVTKFDKKRMVDKLHNCCTFNTISFLIPNKAAARKAAILETKLSGDYGNMLLASFEI